MKHLVNSASFIALCSLLALLYLPTSITPVLAHGGEDHGDGKAATVSTDKGTVTHTAKVGELEVLLKHAPLESDATGAARLFVTRFASNEPLADVAPTIQIIAPDGKTFEAEIEKTNSPGSFTIELPPLAEGKYTILARLKFGGETDTATFSNISVAHAASTDATPNAVVSLWNVLLILIALAGFGAIIIFGYFALRYAARQTSVAAPATRKDAVSI